MWTIDPAITFLNHGSFGACPRPVFEEYQRLELELERRPVEFLARPKRTKTTIPEFMAPGAPPNRLDILRGVVRSRRSRAR